MKGVNQYVPQIVLPKTQISAAAAAWTASDIKEYTEKIPMMPMNRLLVTLFADNVTDEATYAELLSELLNTMYFKSSKYGVLMDVGLGDYEQILRHIYGIPQLLSTGGTADNSERSITYPVMFGRNFADPDLGLPAHSTGTLTSKHQLGTSSGTDGADYKVEADCFADAAFKYIQTITTMTDTPASTGKKRYTIPVPNGGLVKAIMMRTTTAYEAGAVNNPSLYVGGKFAFEFDTIPLIARNFYDRKCAGFTLYADIIGRLEEGYNNPTLYQAIDFGDDIDGWLNPRGQSLELQLNVATAEALRIIPLIAIPT